MNNIVIKEGQIQKMIYEVRGKQVMLDSEMSATKCHDYLYDKIVTYYDIGKPISMLIKTKFFRRV